MGNWQHRPFAIRRHDAGPRNERGMTLIELMVALVLGLVTTYFISQVFAVAEGYKRTATFGTDAQVNGAVAIHTLRRHVMGSGYGVISAPSALGCPIYGEYGTSGSSTATPPMPLAPVVITAATSASAPSDTVSVVTSTKSSFAAPMLVKDTHLASDGTPAFTIESGTHGVKADDTILAVPSGWTAASKCMLFTVKEDNTAPATTLSKSTIPHVASPSASSWNAAPTSAWPAGGFPDKSLILNFGAIRWMNFGVSGDTFQVFTWTAAGIGAAEDLHSGIVLMKALYGRDTDANGTVDTYDTNTPTDNVGWRNVKAVRFVVVARSGQRERDEVTAAAPTWNVGAGAAVNYVGAPGDAATVCAATAATCELPLPLTHVSDWKHYRYKVFDTAVQVRNLMWNAEEPS
jgi:type IV pilus assembly protein PilW